MFSNEEAKKMRVAFEKQRTDFLIDSKNKEKIKQMQKKAFSEIKIGFILLLLFILLSDFLYSEKGGWFSQGVLSLIKPFLIFWPISSISIIWNGYNSYKETEI